LQAAIDVMNTFFKMEDTEPTDTSVTVFTQQLVLVLGRLSLLPSVEW